MIKDKVKDFWRDFIKAWEHLDIINNIDVRVSSIRNKDCLVSKEHINKKVFDFRDEFKPFLDEQLKQLESRLDKSGHYTEIQTYKREYNKYNSKFVMNRLGSWGIFEDNKLELPDDYPDQIKARINLEQFKEYTDKLIERHDAVSLSYFYGRDGLNLPLDTLTDTNGKLYLEHHEYPLLLYVIGKAYYCKFLFDKIEQLKQAQQSTIKAIPTQRKILFLTANPRDEVHLGLEREVRKVMNTLNEATNRQDFELIREPAVGIPDITKAIQRKPEIVHFSGHGNIEGLAVENDSGYSDLFPIAGLDRLFRVFKETTKCVILNACDSKELAKTISKHGIHVIGMNDEIGDEAARKFAVGFYQSLGKGNTYEFAFEMGMVHISNEYDDANTPELWFNGERIKK